MSLFPVLNLRKKNNKNWRAENVPQLVDSWRSMYEARASVLHHHSSSMVEHVCHPVISRGRSWSSRSSLAMQFEARLGFMRLFLKRPKPNSKQVNRKKGLIRTWRVVCVAKWVSPCEGRGWNLPETLLPQIILEHLNNLGGIFLLSSALISLSVHEVIFIARWNCSIRVSRLFLFPIQQLLLEQMGPL